MTFGGAEFRASDVDGRPVDTAAETPTQRCERIWLLQDRRVANGPRPVPPSDPADVFGEWLTLSPANRMSAFARIVAEDPGKLPEAEMEPGPGERPRPGGLHDRLNRESTARRSAMERATEQMR